MKIELKNISFSESLSEETNAFTANVYIDGVKAAYARNDGRGGCTNYHWFDATKKPLVEKAEEYCKSLPPVKCQFGDIDMDLEHKIDLLLEDWLKAKDAKKLENKLKKDMKKGICFEINNGYSLLSWKNLDMDKLLSNENGKRAIKTQLDKLKTEGKKVLNTNIPLELL